MDKDVYFTIIQDIKRQFEIENKILRDKLTASNILHSALYKNIGEGFTRYTNSREYLLKIMIQMIENGEDRDIIIEYYRIFHSYFIEDSKNPLDMFITDYGKTLKNEIITLYQYLGEEFCTKEDLEEFHIDI